MINIEKLKNINNDKEILDIAMDYNEIEYLLSQDNLIGLRCHLQNLAKKYQLELMIHNSQNTTPPTDEYQNAKNWMIFLNNYFDAKLIEKGYNNIKDGDLYE